MIVVFPGSFVVEQKDVPNQYDWRGEEYLSDNGEGRDSDQRVAKGQVDQVLRKACHEFLEVFGIDEVIMGQPQWM